MSNDSQDLIRRIREHRTAHEILLRECLERVGLEPAIFLAKIAPQSAMFMAEIIPIIHRLCLHLPDGTVKTTLDVGPQTFSGTALLASQHAKYTYNRLKLRVSAVDIQDKFRFLKELVAPDVELLVCDIFDIRDRTWDIVVASHVIEHVPDPIRFVERLSRLANDFVIVACPWRETLPLTRGHVNSIGKDAVRAMGARDLHIYTNYNWGKDREVCTFWVEGQAGR